jgi:hypothetical protein
MKKEYEMGKIWVTEMVIQRDFLMEKLLDFEMLEIHLGLE